MNTAPQTPLDEAVNRLESDLCEYQLEQATLKEEGGTPTPSQGFDDLRTVIDALAKARDGQGEWMVKSSDYDRLLNATLDLRSACMHKLPPSLYAGLENECRAIDAITKPAPSQ